LKANEKFFKIIFPLPLDGTTLSNIMKYIKIDEEENYVWDYKDIYIIKNNNQYLYKQLVTIELIEMLKYYIERLLEQN